MMLSRQFVLSLAEREISDAERMTPLTDAALLRAQHALLPHNAYRTFGAELLPAVQLKRILSNGPPLLGALSSIERANAFLNGHEAFASFDPVTPI